MITQERLKELFTYSDGHLIRIVAVGSRGKVGDIAGNPQWQGYLKVKINEQTYFIHRLIFLYHHGYLPKCLDHKDNNILNNKIENLRGCTRSQNLQNSKTPKSNTSGVKGVHWNNKTSRWVAGMSQDKKHYDLGPFVYKENAVLAIKILRNKLSGEFANHG